MKITYETRHVAKQLFCVNVTNTGSMNGDDVVLAYVVPPQVKHDGVSPPIKQLFGFDRVNLNVGETKQVFFPLNIESILTVAKDGSKWLHAGNYHIVIDNQRMLTIELHDQSTLWKRFK
jgi:hypothetical protein